MINNSKQVWTVGSAVKVGFLSLIVVAAIATPGDFAPDAYLLRNVAGTQLYRFVPHCGVEKITVAEGRAMIAGAEALAARIAASALKRASASTAVELLFA